MTTVRIPVPAGDLNFKKEANYECDRNSKKIYEGLEGSRMV